MKQKERKRERKEIKKKNTGKKVSRPLRFSGCFPTPLVGVLGLVGVCG